ncbi:UdgX family uracil-DNA binding protein [Bdellovibrio sp. SKB1291214]|uniref:UdgX family uracil-DNA binding protein n=1 Tax=Bdellovibrio sp. SKB1291214 TaxID=1732569 RepID=UPI000B67D879|nr:UdgX family uracil-DNA binding protein [Bdellovibrio sp. SKB1291214]UYL09741.1 UdgX family uracil-DNA binding protein [Bdellovibrio sp. SKB1291214]
MADSGKMLKKLKKAAEHCRDCDLYKYATQVVFGNGNPKASLIIVGEQPGNEEDLQGEPFVGPAGGVLRKCLEAAGIDISSVYLTNAVKHFKFKTAGTGKRRIHDKPNTAQIKACHHWLQDEIMTIHPQIILALGVTAGRSVLGRNPTISQERGKDLNEADQGPSIYVSWHPSAILRSPDREKSDQLRKELIQDLKKIAKLFNI